MSSNTYHRSDNAEAYRQNASFVYSAAYTSAVIGLLDPKPGDRILDLGCGSGELTLDLARLLFATSEPSGYVLGIDASSDMVESASRLVDAARCKDASNVSVSIDFQVVDGHRIIEDLNEEVKGSFDKVFSNAALHWMKASPAAVIRGVRAALKPNGVFAAELGGFLNCIGVRSLLHEACRSRGVDPEAYDPWFFPTAKQYRTLLESNGFVVDHCELVPRITELPQSSGVKGWLRTFAGPFLNAFEDDAVRRELLDEVEARLRPDCYDAEEDRWTIMYVRLRVRATAKGTA